MKKYDIELPPIPDLQTFPASVFNHEVMVMDHVAVTNLLKEYAISAIEVDRQRSGEPVAWRYKTPTGWHATADAARALGVAKHHSVEPLYAALQPTEPAERKGDGCNCDQGQVCQVCDPTNMIMNAPSTDEIIGAVKEYGNACANQSVTATELEMRLHEIRDLLVRYGHPAISEGWQLVPKVPTHEMIKALWKTITEKHETTDGGYAAMLKASPKFGEES